MLASADAQAVVDAFTALSSGTRRTGLKSA
jgi:hypothetical protein